MAAPTATTRPAPGGRILRDGFSTKISFSRDTDVSLWEKTVTPPGLDGEDAIDISTMHNTDWRTFHPRSLMTMTEMSCTVGYDPACYTQLIELINAPGSITVIFPDGTTLAFYGYLRTFEPSENTEGEMPEADITIQCTNFDPINSVEAAPVITSVAGT